MRKIHPIGLFCVVFFCFLAVSVVFVSPSFGEQFSFGDATAGSYGSGNRFPDAIVTGDPPNTLTGGEMRMDDHVVVEKFNGEAFTFYQTGGKIFFPGTNAHFHISHYGGGAEYIMSGGELWTQCLKIGNQHNARMEQSGGMVTVGSLLVANESWGVNAEYFLSGDAKVRVTSNDDVVDGNYSLDFAHGARPNAVVIGNNGGTNGYMSVDLNPAGYVETPYLIVARDGTGKLELKNGLMTVTNEIRIAEGNGNGTLDFSGGTLLIGTGGVTKGDGSATINLNGNWRESAPHATIGVYGTGEQIWAADVHLNFHNGGTYFEVNENQKITILGNMSGGQRIIKTGTGVLELSGENRGVWEVIEEGTVRRTGGFCDTTVWLGDAEWWNNTSRSYYELAGGTLYGDIHLGVTSYGEMTVSDNGRIQNNDLRVGFGNGWQGVLNIENGGIVNTNWLSFARDGSRGTLNLNEGGILQVNNAIFNNGMNLTGNTINLAGGTFEVNTDDIRWESGVNANFVAGTNTTFNTKDKTITIWDGVPFSGTGTLTKTGSGKLDLQGTKSFGGTLIMEQGSLTADNFTLDGKLSLVAPNTPVTIANFTQSADSILEVYLDLSSDGTSISNSLVNITGDLELSSDALLHLVLTDSWAEFLAENCAAELIGLSAEIFTGNVLGISGFSSGHIITLDAPMDGFHWRYANGAVTLDEIDGVPEPAAWVLMFLGLAGMAGLVRRRR